MHTVKILLASLFLAVPALGAVDESNVPGGTTWYLHVDLKKMKSEEGGKAIYSWLREEAFADVMEDIGIDLDKELDRITAFAQDGSGPVILLEGKISQETKDKAMTMIAATGDLDAGKSSGKTYYHMGDDAADEDNGDKLSYKSGDIDITIDALEDNAWVSLDLKNKVLITASEEKMQALLANNGKIPGGRGNDDALIVLTAEKTLLQAGMNSKAMNDEDSGWNSKILRNTEQVAIIVAAVANKLAVEAKLVATEPDVAESLASVVRGLISLAAFSDELDDDAITMLQSTKVNAKGNSLSISLVVDPDLVVATLDD